MRKSATQRSAVIGLTAALLASTPLALAACESDGRRSTGWRFGPDDRTSRTRKGTDEAPAVIEPTQRVISATSVSKGELRERALSTLQGIAASGTPEERGNAIEALSKTPARLSGIIEPALSDPSPGLRSLAAMVIGKARLEGHGDQLAVMVSDQSVFVRSAALFALKRTGARVDLSQIADMLVDSQARVRAQGAFILGELGEKSALGPLREAARDAMSRANPAEVRLMQLQVGEARVKLGEEAGLSDIRAALFPARSEDLEATALACQIIGEVRDQSSVNQLINLTQQKDDSGAPMPAEIRLAAAGGLARVGRQPRNAAAIAREYLSNPSDAIRAQAAYVLGESGDYDSLGALDELMKDSVGRVRVAAAAAIVKITSTRG